MDAQRTQLTLDSLRPGARARIVALEGDPRGARRLADLGFWPETAIEVMRRAPFGDPTVYRLQGYRIALRRSEARCVIVDPLPAEAP